MERILKSIFKYPVKSLGGITLESSLVEPTGLIHDRKWMLINEEGHFMTQRKYPQMALLKVEEDSQGLSIRHEQEQIAIPKNSEGELFTSKVWDQPVLAAEVSSEINQWLSDRLGIKAKLLLNKGSREAIGMDQGILFSDSSPFLLIGNASFEHLNSLLTKPVKINRFRPNLVVDGFGPYAEDSWNEISIGDCIFQVTRPCSRCKLPNVNQETGIPDQELLKFLSTHRRADNGTVNFGVHLILLKGKELKVNDKVVIVK